MAQRTVMEPAYIARLSAAIRKRLSGAKISHEQVRRDRYRFIVVSSRFDRLGHPERQRLVGDIADAALTKPELLKVAMILTLGIKEIAA